jgi:hypothetical protein
MNASDASMSARRALKPASNASMLANGGWTNGSGGWRHVNGATSTWVKPIP